jgi:hypothetical protein
MLNYSVLFADKGPHLSFPRLMFLTNYVLSTCVFYPGSCWKQKCCRNDEGNKVTETVFTGSRKFITLADSEENFSRP